MKALLKHMHKIQAFFSELILSGQNYVLGTIPRNGRLTSITLLKTQIILHNTITLASLKADKQAESEFLL